MSFLCSLNPEAGLLQIFQAFPETARPLLEYQKVLLRGESSFDPTARSNCAGVNRRQKSKILSVHCRSQCSGGGIPIIVSYGHTYCVSARDKERF